MPSRDQMSTSYDICCAATCKAYMRSRNLCIRCEMYVHHKSEFMLISTRPVTTPPMLRMGNSFVKQVNSVKYLGVFVDCNLKYGDHIYYVENKLLRLVGVSYRLRNFLNYSSAVKFYYGFVYSCISYCISVWGGVLMCTERGSRLI